MATRIRACEGGVFWTRSGRIYPWPGEARGWEARTHLVGRLRDELWVVKGQSNSVIVVLPEMHLVQVWFTAEVELLMADGPY